MKNIQKIVFCLAVFMASLFHTVQAQPNLLVIADLLTKASYSSPAMQHHVLILTQPDIIFDTSSNTVINLPSTQEILQHITSLQNPQGFIHDKEVKKLAIKALYAAIQATDRAIEIATFQRFDIQLRSLLPSTLYINPILVEILKNQKFILQDKMTQLKQKFVWEIITQPSTIYVAIGVAALLTITGTAAYYYLLYDDTPDDNSNDDVILSPDQFKKAINMPSYQKIRKILARLADPNDQQHVSVYFNEAETLIKELDPELHKDLIKMLNIFIESKHRADVGIFTEQQRENSKFWLRTHKKKDKLTNLFIGVLNSKDDQIKKNAPNGNRWLAQDIDLEKIVRSKIPKD